MDSRIFTFLTIAVLVGIGLLLLLNVMTLFNGTIIPGERYISQVEVKSISIVNDSKETPLNFEQKNAVISFLNRASPIDKDLFLEKGTSPQFSKIVIYYFNKPELTIKPIKYIDNELIFSQDEWNPKGLLRDNTKGLLKSVLSQFVSSDKAPEKQAEKQPEEHPVEKP